MSKNSPVENTDNFFMGEDKTLRFNVVDVNGAAQNISGWGLEWVLRLGTGNPTAAITKSTVSGITISNGAGGICDVAVAAADSLALSPGGYFHTLRRNDSGFSAVLAFGTFALQEAATR